MAQETSQPAPADDITQLPFEKALEELEKIVSRMERERLPVEVLLRAFEQGNQLAAHCRTKLDELEQRIEVLTKKEEGSEDWQPF